MGFLKRLFNEIKSQSQNTVTFSIESNSKDDDYDWDKNYKTFKRYENEVKISLECYYDLLEEIEKRWSTIYNLGDYNGPLAKSLERLCFKDIEYYKKMRDIQKKYKQVTPSTVPAYKRLAMLYERQKDYEKSIEICKEACLIGVNEYSRLARMIKKSGRTPTKEEMNLLNQVQ